MSASTKSLAASVAAILFCVSPALAGTTWPDPQRIWAGDYSEPSMAVVGGKAHIAATGSTGIWYLTNRTGPWTRVRLTDSTTGQRVERHSRPLIAVDAGDGSITVAFHTEVETTGSCGSGLEYVTNRTGDWSRRKPVPTPNCPGATSLVAQGGDLALAVKGEGVWDAPAVVAFVSNASGKWTSTTLPGQSPSLALDGGGKPHIAYLSRPGATCCSLWYARESTTTGGFVRERVLGAAERSLPSIALNAAGKPRIAWTESDGTHYAARGATGWRERTVMPGGSRAALDIDGNGKAHLISVDDDGLWYGTNASGSWQSELIDARSTEGFGDIDVTASGRVHIAYQRGSTFEHSRVWYLRSER